MNSVALICAFSLAVVSVNGGSQRIVRQSGGWSQPAGVQINEVGASQAVGIAGAVAEHGEVVSVAGSVEVPALVSLGSGSNVGLSQSASNYQNSAINSDGSSNAYQGNYASNDGYANEYLYGNAQGVNVDVTSSGWSAVEGEGAIGQADALDHTAPGVASGSG